MTNIAKRTDTNAGLKKGIPRLFVRGHAGSFKRWPVKEQYVIDLVTGCWNWLLSTRNGNGYGRVHIHGKRIQAHRFYYEQMRGPIPDGLTLDHLCHNRACVNPDHLEPVTRGENSRRGTAKLTRNDVAEIRRLAAEGMMLKHIAPRFEITAGHVSEIVGGKHWRD